VVHHLVSFESQGSSAVAVAVVAVVTVGASDSSVGAAGKVETADTVVVGIAGELFFVTGAAAAAAAAAVVVVVVVAVVEGEAVFEVARIVVAILCAKTPCVS
jgi:hypothetical protein